jgi:hypothetical protein
MSAAGKPGARPRGGEGRAWSLVWAKRGEHYWWPSILMPRDIARKARERKYKNAMFKRPPPDLKFAHARGTAGSCVRASVRVRVQCAAECGLATGPPAGGGSGTELVAIYFGQKFEWCACVVRWVGRKMRAAVVAGRVAWRVSPCAYVNVMRERRRRTNDVSVTRPWRRNAVKFSAARCVCRSQRCDACDHR